MLQNTSQLITSRRCIICGHPHSCTAVGRSKLAITRPCTCVCRAWPGGSCHSFGRSGPGCMPSPYEGQKCPVIRQIDSVRLSQYTYIKHLSPIDICVFIATIRRHQYMDITHTEILGSRGSDLSENSHTHTYNINVCVNLAHHRRLQNSTYGKRFHAAQSML